MRPLLATAILVALVALIGCSADHHFPTKPATPSWNVRIQITDSPGAFDEVNLQIDQVAIYRESPNPGWEILSQTSQTVDLMTLRNGVFATLGLGMVQPGTYSQIRLKLGSGSNVVVQGVTSPLKVPSGMESGYKLNGTFVVPENRMLDLALDFDASRSIVQTGNGKYILKPVVTVVPFSTAGAIAGRVLPDTADVEVFALSGADTVAHATPGPDNSFKIDPIAEGTYDVAIHPSHAFFDTTLSGVKVVHGMTTELGDIVLTHK
jgi:hypothetical protein